MSLINQMLKDLEARRERHDGAGEQAVTVAPCYQKTPRRFRHRPVVLVAVLIIIGVLTAIAAWWYIMPQSLVQQLPPERQVVQVAPSAAVVAKEPQAQAAPTDSVVSGVAASVMAMEPVLPPVKVVAAPEQVAQLAVPTQRALPETWNKPLSAPQKALQPPTAADVPAVAAHGGEVTTSALTLSEETSASQQAKGLRIQAQRLLEQYNYSAAVLLLQQAVDLAGATAEQWHQLVVAYLQARQVPAASRAADSGCQQYPNDVALRVIQARLLLETGHSDQALAALQLVIPSPPVATASEFYALLATVQQRNGDFSAAQQNYALLSGTFPGKGEWWIGRAICSDQLGQSAAATAYFQQALRCSQLSPQLKHYALQQLQRLNKG